MDEIQHKRKMYLTGRVFSFMLEVKDSNFPESWEVRLLGISKTILTYLNMGIVSLDIIEECLADEENTLVMIQQKKLSLELGEK